MQMTRSVEVYIVVWSQYITLKLFSRTLKKRHKGTPFSHFSSSILQNFCYFNVLKQGISICSNLDNDSLKTSLDKGILYSY